MMRKGERLGQILAELQKAVGPDAAAIVSRDGILLASKIPETVHGETFAIMSATMLGAAITAHSELGKATPVRVVVESEDGCSVVCGAGTDSLLVVTMKESMIKIAAHLAEIDRAAEKIKALD